jgi:ribonuclease R
MNGDKVVVRIEARPRGRNPVGRVIKVLERAHPSVVGVYRASHRFGYVVPQDRKVMRDVLIPGGEEQGARESDIVVAEITSYGDGKLNPVGKIVRVLGAPDDPGVDVLAIVHGHRLPLEFPPEVITEAERAAGHPVAAGNGRVDRRDLLVFTIDPADLGGRRPHRRRVELRGARLRTRRRGARAGHERVPRRPRDPDASARSLVGRVLAQA